MAGVDATTFVVVSGLMQAGDVPEYRLEDFAAPRPAWHAQAACRGAEHVAEHFPERGESLDAARARCAACPVDAPCLDAALADPTLAGVWAGTSTGERRRMRQEIAA